MSTFTIENHGIRRFENQVPQWMKAERLEYCEQEADFRLKESKRRHFLIQMLFSILG